MLWTNLFHICIHLILTQHPHTSFTPNASDIFINLCINALYPHNYKISLHYIFFYPDNDDDIASQPATHIRSISKNQISPYQLTQKRKSLDTLSNTPSCYFSDFFYVNTSQPQPSQQNNMQHIHSLLISEIYSCVTCNDTVTYQCVAM